MKVYQTKVFKKHYKTRISGLDEKIIEIIIGTLLNQKPLDIKFNDHKLTGGFSHCRECHIKNDLLLIYQIIEDELRLIDIGTHSQLFG